MADLDLNRNHRNHHGWSGRKWGHGGGGGRLAVFGIGRNGLARVRKHGGAEGRKTGEGATSLDGCTRGCGLGKVFYPLNWCRRCNTLLHLRQGKGWRWRGLGWRVYSCRDYTSSRESGRGTGGMPRGEADRAVSSQGTRNPPVHFDSFSNSRQGTTAGGAQAQARKSKQKHSRHTHGHARAHLRMGHERKAQC
jgi:hypothetical protein